MDYKIIPSTCSYCGCGCGVLFQVFDGKLAGTLPMKTHPVNEGKLCIKGWNLHEYVISDKRLKSPLIKKDGKLQETTWDEAIQAAADRLKAIIKAHGPDSVGVLVSAKCASNLFLASSVSMFSSPPRTIFGSLIPAFSSK